MNLKISPETQFSLHPFGWADLQLGGKDFFFMKQLQLDLEVWKPVVGYEGYFSVSNLGNIRGDERTVKGPHGTRKVISRPKGQTILPTGYVRVVLYKDGSGNSQFVHRLVALAFIPNPESKPQVNHKNGTKGDNRSTNLEWCTSRENISHAWGSIPNSSKFIGVKWNKENKKWVACLSIKHQRLHLGYFKNEIDAANAYQKKLAEINGTPYIPIKEL